MIQKLLVVGVAIALTSTASTAQDVAADEKAIRGIIAAMDKGETPPQTKDSIFWSGALKRPAVRGQDKPEPTPATLERGPITAKTRVRRIEVAKSGDMAYEFSDAELMVEAKPGIKPVQPFATSILRVWKKVDGQWQIAARFSHRHEP